MALKKTTKTEEKATIHAPEVGAVKVIRANKLESGVVMFDVIISETVKVTGLSARPYSNENGEGVVINFPSRQDAKDLAKYWKYAFFPITSELKDDIIDQIDAITG